MLCRYVTRTILSGLSLLDLQAKFAVRKVNGLAKDSVFLLIVDSIGPSWQYCHVSFNLNGLCKLATISIFTRLIIYAVS